MYIYIYIRRPLPGPRKGRRPGPPEVWNLKLATAMCSMASLLHPACLLNPLVPAENQHWQKALARRSYGRSSLPFGDFACLVNPSPCREPALPKSTGKAFSWWFKPAVWALETLCKPTT